MSQAGKSVGILCVALTAIIIAGVSLPGAIAQVDRRGQGRGAFNLGATILIDPQGTAYFSNPDGSITAVKLDSGAQLWTTPKGKSYRPLAVSGKFLVAMQEGGGAKPDNQLGVAFLQSLDGGEHLVNWVELPANAWTSVKNGLGASLQMNAATGLDGRVTLSWVSERQPEVRGIAPDAEEELDVSVKKVKTTQVEVHSGTVEIEPGGRMLPPIRGLASAQLSQPVRQDLSEDQRLKGIPGVQFISSDSKHVLVSEMVGNDRELNKYRWTIYSGAAEAVGTVTTPFASAPFFVSGSTLFYELRPFMIRDSSDQLVRSPLKLVAMDLRTGGKLWEYAVLDTEYYGPYPH